MLNLCSSFEIIIAQNNRNKLSQVWIEETKTQFESVIEWHHCNSLLISECIGIHPNALIVLDLLENFEGRLRLSQLCKENNKIHLVPQKKCGFSYYDEWTYEIIPSDLAQVA